MERENAGSRRFGTCEHTLHGILCNVQTPYPHDFNTLIGGLLPNNSVVVTGTISLFVYGSTSPYRAAWGRHALLKLHGSRTLKNPLDSIYGPPMSNTPRSLSHPSFTPSETMNRPRTQEGPLYNFPDPSSAYLMNTYPPQNFSNYQHYPSATQPKEPAPGFPQFSTSPQTQASASPPSSISSFDEVNAAYHFLSAAPPEYPPSNTWEILRGNQCMHSTFFAT